MKHKDQFFYSHPHQEHETHSLSKLNSKILKRIIAKRCFNSSPSPKCSSLFPELVFNLGLHLQIRRDDNPGGIQTTLSNDLELEIITRETK